MSAKVNVLSFGGCRCIIITQVKICFKVTIYRLSQWFSQFIVQQNLLWWQAYTKPAQVCLHISFGGLSRKKTTVPLYASRGQSTLFYSLEAFVCFICHTSDLHRFRLISEMFSSYVPQKAEGKMFRRGDSCYFSSPSPSMSWSQASPCPLLSVSFWSLLGTVGQLSHESPNESLSEFCWSLLGTKRQLSWATNNTSCDRTLYKAPFWLVNWIYLHLIYI